MTDPIAPIRATAIAGEAYPPSDKTAAPPPASAKSEESTPAAQAARSGATSQPVSEAVPNVHFRFKVDPATNDVTVIMFDATARKVLRTIPAREMQRLTQGELLELWA